jgi:acetyl/propionyl-CoA carboxylase alpha subunit
MTVRTVTPVTRIDKLLVANRGEIARRIFRTARRMGISTVAVFSDVDAQAPHVGEADEAVNLRGATPAETYLDVDAVIAAAKRTGADAIHPGYGFLSENAAFARRCQAEGITFVGPTPETIDAMGSKVAAKEMMAAAGVPVLPGATVLEGDDLTAAAAVTGWPVLVKAAFGGGGRGMRVVRTEAELAEAVASARREAASAFGNDMVFLERYVDDPRHIEVQVFGDTHGTIAHLFERECSIQRRYQKIIEEAPSPAMDDERRGRLCEAAVAAARAVGYVGAGTVEFVVDQAGEFFFLEMNTRLQVEHPVTEMVTGLDLVELQLSVARGAPLPPEVLEASLRGHAIEARLYAEDVHAGFAPVSGRIDRLEVPDDGHIRVDSGYESGSTVSTFYDAMLAKVIAWAPTRAEATDALAGALTRAHVNGPPTNRDLLVNVLRHDEFVAGRLDTGFLDRNDCTTSAAGTASTGIHALAAALAAQAGRRAGSTFPSGWRNVPTAMQRFEYDVLHVPGTPRVAVGYRFERDGVSAEIDGERIDVRLWTATPDAVELTAGDVRRRFDVHRAGPLVYVHDGTTASTLRDVERFVLPGTQVASGSLLAPMPGTVVRVGAAVGDRVEAGQALVVIEAMKMEHRINSPANGTLASIIAVGAAVENNTVLAVVEADDDE